MGGEERRRRSWGSDRGRCGGKQSNPIRVKQRTGGRALCGRKLDPQAGTTTQESEPDTVENVNNYLSDGHDLFFYMLSQR